MVSRPDLTSVKLPFAHEPVSAGAECPPCARPDASSANAATGKASTASFRTREASLPQRRIPYLMRIGSRNVRFSNPDKVYVSPSPAFCDGLLCRSPTRCAFPVSGVGDGGDVGAV